MSVASFANIFSHSEGCLYVLFMVSFAVQNLLSFIRSHLFLLDLAVIYVIECSAYVSSKSFIMSGLTFSSLIQFEFTFVYGFRECSYFILLHVAVQFSQHHLLKRLSFLHCIFLPTLSKVR